MKQYLAVTTKLITDCSYRTNWELSAQLFGLEGYVSKTYRLLRSQSWGDDDYPSCVLNLFNAILESEGEEKTKSFINYVLNEELKNASEVEYILKLLIRVLNLV